MSIAEVVAGTRPWWIECGNALDVLKQMEAGVVQTCVTSPPYFGLRAYGIGKEAGEIGMESTPQEFVAALVAVFAEVHRVLRPDGTLWVNIADSFSGGGRVGHGKRVGNKQETNRGSLATGDRRVPMGPGVKAKDLCLIPQRFVLAMQEFGWFVRSEIIWLKQSPQPESVRDRPTKATEMIYLFSKKKTYYYDTYAVRESVAESTIERDAYSRILDDPDEQFAVAHDHETVSDLLLGRNLWNWWVMPPDNFKGKHYATFPSSLPFRAIKLGTSEKGCCPMCGKCWKRTVERRGMKKNLTARAHELRDAGVRTACQGTMTEAPAVRLLGWEPGCKCNAGDPIPCLVLDPFVGSGTSGLVAHKLCRRFMGIDLSPEYAEMARKRINDNGPLFSTPAVAEDDQTELFAEEPDAED